MHIHKAPHLHALGQEINYVLKPPAAGGASRDPSANIEQRRLFVDRAREQQTPPTEPDLPQCTSVEWQIKTMCLQTLERPFAQRKL